MPIKRGNPDQYLQKVGDTYYARVRVPRTLEKLVGQTHVRRSLKTGSKAEANQRKHKLVADLKAELAAWRKSPPKDGAPGLTLADARAFREQLQTLRESHREQDEEQVSTLEQLASDMAERVEALHGTQRAAKWFRAATDTTDTLSDLMGKWLDASDYRESTKAGHRKALADLLEFLEDEEARPRDVTRKTAARYVEAITEAKKLAHTTIRDRLISLGGFWAWMDSKALLPPNTANPWAGHRISKAQNPGTRPPKRPGGFTPAELLLLLHGAQAARTWPTWSYLPDLMILGMFTGSRIEKLCDLTTAQVEAVPAGYLLHIEGDKTEAGNRLVGITHPAAAAVLKRRVEDRPPGAVLFHELTPGGLDDKMSASASKAFGRYRRACEVPDGTDFHSYRRCVVDVLVKAKPDLVEIARFVGHKVGTLAADTYAGQSLTPAQALEVACRVRYPEEVEAAALALALQHRPRPAARAR